MRSPNNNEHRELNEEVINDDIFGVYALWKKKN